jgi:hypothetical protein
MSAVLTLLSVSLKLHNDQLHNLNVTQNIIKMIKSRRIRSSGHVAHIGRKRR